MRDDGLVRLAIVFGFGISLLVCNAYVMARMASVDKRLVTIESALDKAKTQLADVRVRSDASSRNAGRTIAAIRDELQEARKQAAEAVGEAKASADHRVKELASELNTRASSEQAHRRELERLSTELSKVTDATSKTDAKIGEVKTEVVEVKSALAADRASIERATQDLKRVKGDLGMQSGLIATNGRELAALRTLGEKNYYDITLPMKKLQVVAGVRFLLKKTDPKRLRFSLEVIASDKKTEKKDRLVNEPVQFLVSKTKGPYQLEVDDMYELVINEVTRDEARGYVATPKGSSPPTGVASR